MKNRREIKVGKKMVDPFIIEISKTFKQKIELIERKNTNKSLFELDVEAIVSPTNTYLHTDNLYPIGYEIWARGGSHLQEEIENLRASKTLQLNKAVVTTGGEFKGIKVFVHLPVLRRPEFIKDPAMARKAFDLYNGIKNVLEVATENRIESIAIPELGTSIKLIEGFVGGIVSYFREERIDDMRPLHIYIVTKKGDYKDYKEELMKRKPELERMGTIKTLVKESKDGIVSVSDVIEALELESDLEVIRILQRSDIREIMLDRRRNQIIRLPDEEEVDYL